MHLSQSLGKRSKTVKEPTAFSVSSERHWQSGVNRIAKVPKRKVLRFRTRPGRNFFFLTMLRQHSQYDSRLGFSFRVLVSVRLGLGLGLELGLGFGLGFGLALGLGLGLILRLGLGLGLGLT